MEDQTTGSLSCDLGSNWGEVLRHSVNCLASCPAKPIFSNAQVGASVGTEGVERSC